MPLPEILTAIEDEAAARAAAIAVDARRRSEAVLSAARERAESERRRLAAARDGAAGLASARIVNQARLEADRALHAAQEELYQQAVDQARHRLSSLRETPAYPEVFGVLLAEAQRALPDADTVRIDPRDDDVASSALDPGHPIVVDRSLTTWGGVQLTTDDGRLVDNTLESRLYRADPALRRLAVSICPELATGFR